MFVSGSLRNFIFKVNKNQALFALRQDSILDFVSDEGVGNSFWQVTFDEGEGIDCLGDLIGRQLCPAFAGLENPIKIVAEVVCFCGSSFGSGLVFVVGVEALAVEDGAKYCFQVPTLRAAKFSCIL